MTGAHHSCPAPSDSSGSSSLPEKGRMIGLNQTYHIKRRHIHTNLADRISAIPRTTSPYSRG
ncbi:hypothetical protein Taro_001979 [Colocasia esculenta]|uniref:Uncharacterized protein n=1 Tax=Colocasia esculenta TaxID=4460 RepID=A0A843TJN0_COLES|nr:hypothetical protein [Colocasia esculenta]